VSDTIAAAVDEGRLWRRLDALACHGARADGGVDRPALSDAEAAAKRQLMDWGAELGLVAYTDALANLFLRWDVGADLPAVLVGSHVDSQPTGGRYDGTFGVLAGLEAIAALRTAGVRPQRPIEMVAWTNEEGSRFAPGMMGSAGYAGARGLAEILAVRDAQSISVAEAIAAQAARLPPLPRRALGRQVHCYIEPHIEQGPVLEAAGVALGVVTGMQGKRTFRVRLTGEAAHAGTAPRASRRDALLAAARAVLALEAGTADPDDIVRFTVGRLTVTPNAPSVVAAAAEFSIDLRHPDADMLHTLGNRVAGICADVAPPCTAEVEELSCAPPQVFDAGLRTALHRAAREVGVAALDIASAAGHDARYLEPICPTAMLFIPCRGGITHNPAEAIESAHAVAATRVLAVLLAAQTATALAAKTG
jgi:N-carbamoyl-L-amino-acid hydrolase